MPPLFPGLKPHPIPGAEINLGGFLFFVPPMRLIDLRQSVDEKLLDIIAATRKVTPEGDAVEWSAFGSRNAEGSDPQCVIQTGATDAILTLAERSLKRNYPEITREQIEDVVDAINSTKLVELIIVRNGLANRPSWAEAPPPPAVVPPQADPSMSASGSTSSAA